eukprot:scaffold1884_cov343-Ochromonas_danica.AAC.28
MTTKTALASELTTTWKVYYMELLITKSEMKSRCGLRLKQGRRQSRWTVPFQQTNCLFNQGFLLILSVLSAIDRINSFTCQLSIPY